MSVEERLQKPGRFSLAFVEDTPYSVRSIFGESTAINVAPFGFLGHVFITPTRVPAENQTLTHLTSVARYTGVMRRRQRRGISGSGLLVYFGDENGVGATFTSHLRLTQGFSAWINDLYKDEPAGYLNPFDTGTITNIGASTFEFDPFGITRREALDIVADAFGGYYRVNPDNTFDAGPASSLFVTDPTKVLLPRDGSSDHTIEGLKALSLDLEVDYEEVANRFLYFLEGEGTFEDVFIGTIRPKDLNGNAIDMCRRLSTQNVGPNGIVLMSPQEATRSTRPRREIKTSLTGYDVPSDVQPGDTIAVYDPLNLLFDTANPVAYGGTVIYPIELQVYAITWPVQPGMGVYYRNSDTGTVTDLTDWIAWETGDTALEVGAAKRELTQGPLGGVTSALGGQFRAPAARVTHSANQSINNATDTALAFDTELYDPAGMHDTGALVRHRFTIPIDGKYRLTVNAEFASNATGFRHIQFLKNGTDIIAAITVPAATGVPTRLELSTEDEFVDGDFIEPWVHQTSGGALNVVAASAYTPIYTISKVAA